MKYLLDTNIISELISNQPNQSVLDFLSLINENDIYLYLSFLSKEPIQMDKVLNDSKMYELLYN